MQGYIKLHRKFNEWEWRNSPKHVAVFLDLLLNANHKEKRYRGVLIGTGQLTTSYQAISKRTGVTVRGVRTVLKDLISTNEVTHEGRRHYSIITIVNWGKYQIDDTRNDIDMTSRRQPSDNLVTTNKNVKNVKNVKEVISHLNYSCGKSFKHTTPKTQKLISARLSEGFGVDDFKKVIDVKKGEWLEDEKMSRYLRPETLFGSKFESYLNEVTDKPNMDALKKSLLIGGLDE